MNTINFTKVEEVQVFGNDMLACNDPGVIIEALSYCLEKEKQGSAIGFYGCGKLANDIVNSCQPHLKRLQPFFIVTEPGEKRSFYQYPILTPQEAVLRSPERVYILSMVYSDIMVENLNALQPEIILTLRRILSSLPAEELKEIYMLKNKDRIEKNVCQLSTLFLNGKPIIFFALSGVVNEALKLMYFIRRGGWNLVLFTSGDLVNGMPLTDYEGKGYFDHKIVSPSYAYDLLIMSEKIKVDLIHFDVGVCPGAPIAEVVCNSNVPVVVRYLDIKELVYWENKALWRKEIGEHYYPFEELAGEVIFKKSAGVIFKDSPEVIDILTNLYGHEPKKNLYFPSFPSTTFSTTKESLTKLSSLDGRMHLVYCGLIFNTPGHKLRQFFRSIIEIARTLTAQGLDFTIYNGLDPNGNGFEEYMNLDSDLELFHYEFAKKPVEIGHIMTQYDFAFFCFDQSKNLDSDVYQRTTFGSKIFSFMEAGLPIIISSETEFMATFVEENKLGISISYNELSSVRERIESTDWEPIRESISEKRKSWAMEKQINKIFSFYDSIINSAKQN